MRYDFSCVLLVKSENVYVYIHTWEYTRSRNEYRKAAISAAAAVCDVCHYLADL